MLPPQIDAPSQAVTECWFDEPVADDRRSRAMPSGHGSYRGLELELLDPANEDELMLLLEAQHTELADAVDSWEEMTVDGEQFSPRLHLAMHQIVANQLLADDPPETWRISTPLQRTDAAQASRLRCSRITTFRCCSAPTRGSSR
jgi:hypothetical protein